MQEAKQTLEPRVYRMRRMMAKIALLSFVLLCIMILGGLVSLCIFLLTKPFGLASMFSLVALGIGIFFFSWLLYILVAQSQQSIELSQEGILYIGPDFQLYTPWSNLAGLGTLKFPLATIRTLELKEAPLDNISLSEGKIYGRAVIARRRWQSMQSYGVSFPLGLLSKKDWQDGGFSSTLQRFFAASEGYPITVSTEASIRNQRSPIMMSPLFWLSNVGSQFLGSMVFLSIKANWLSLFPVSLAYILAGLILYVLAFRKFSPSRSNSWFFLAGFFGAAALALGLTYLAAAFFVFSKIILFFLIFLPLFVLLLVISRIRKRFTEMNLEPQEL